MPQELLEVHDPLLCPVSAELALIRRAWIEKVGPFDEVLEGPHASLDYCLRVHAEGGECVLEPTVKRPRPGEGRRRARRRRTLGQTAAPQARGRELPTVEPGGRLMSDIPKTVFLGLGASVVSYYRAFLPAVTLGAEYVHLGRRSPSTRS